MGARIAGKGTEKFEDTEGRNTQITRTDFSDISGPFLLSADALYNIRLTVANLVLRVGLGVSVLPDVEIDPEEERFSDFSFGTALDTTGVIEAVIPVTKNVGILGRGFFGPSFLFLGGDQQDSVDDERENSPNLDISDGPFVGLTGGLSVGAIYRINPYVGLRAEFMWQKYNQPTFQADGDEQELSDSLSGDRYFLLAGVEF